MANTGSSGMVLFAYISFALGGVLVVGGCIYVVIWAFCNRCLPCSSKKKKQAGDQESVGHAKFMDKTLSGRGNASALDADTDSLNYEGHTFLTADTTNGKATADAGANHKETKVQIEQGGDLKKKHRQSNGNVSSMVHHEEVDEVMSTLRRDNSNKKVRNSKEEQDKRQGIVAGGATAAIVAAGAATAIIVSDQDDDGDDDNIKVDHHHQANELHTSPEFCHSQEQNSSVSESIPKEEVQNSKLGDSFNNQGHHVAFMPEEDFIQDNSDFDANSLQQGSDELVNQTIGPGMSTELVNSHNRFESQDSGDFEPLRHSPVEAEPKNIQETSFNSEDHVEYSSSYPQNYQNDDENHMASNGSDQSSALPDVVLDRDNALGPQESFIVEELSYQHVSLIDGTNKAQTQEAQVNFTDLVNRNSIEREPSTHNNDDFVVNQDLGIEEKAQYNTQTPDGIQSLNNEDTPVVEQSAEQHLKEQNLDQGFFDNDQRLLQQLQEIDHRDSVIAAGKVIPDTLDIVETKPDIDEVQQKYSAAEEIIQDSNSIEAIPDVRRKQIYSDTDENEVLENLDGNTADTFAVIGASMAGDKIRRKKKKRSSLFGKVKRDDEQTVRDGEGQSEHDLLSDDVDRSSSKKKKKKKKEEEDKKYIQKEERQQELERRKEEKLQKKQEKQREKELKKSKENKTKGKEEKSRKDESILPVSVPIIAAAINNDKSEDISQEKEHEELQGEVHNEAITVASSEKSQKEREKEEKQRRREHVVEEKKKKKEKKLQQKREKEEEIQRRKEEDKKEHEEKELKKQKEKEEKEKKKEMEKQARQVQKEKELQQKHEEKLRGKHDKVEEKEKKPKGHADPRNTETLIQQDPEQVTTRKEDSDQDDSHRIVAPAAIAVLETSQKERKKGKHEEKELRKETEKEAKEKKKEWEKQEKLSQKKKELQPQHEKEEEEQHLKSEQEEKELKKKLNPKSQDNITSNDESDQVLTKKNTTEETDQDVDHHDNQKLASSSVAALEKSGMIKKKREREEKEQRKQQEKEERLRKKELEKKEKLIQKEKELQKKREKEEERLQLRHEKDEGKDSKKKTKAKQNKEVPMPSDIERENALAEEHATQRNEESNQDNQTITPAGIAVLPTFSEKSVKEKKQEEKELKKQREKEEKQRKKELEREERESRKEKELQLKREKEEKARLKKENKKNKGTKKNKNLEDQQKDMVGVETQADKEEIITPAKNPDQDAEEVHPEVQSQTLAVMPVTDMPDSQKKDKGKETNEEKSKKELEKQMKEDKKEAQRREKEAKKEKEHLEKEKVLEQKREKEREKQLKKQQEREDKENKKSMKKQKHNTNAENNDNESSDQESQQSKSIEKGSNKEKKDKHSKKKSKQKAFAEEHNDEDKDGQNVINVNEDSKAELSEELQAREESKNEKTKSLFGFNRKSKADSMSEEEGKNELLHAAAPVVGIAATGAITAGVLSSHQRDNDDNHQSTNNQLEEPPRDRVDTEEEPYQTPFVNKNLLGAEVDSDSLLIADSPGPQARSSPILYAEDEQNSSFGATGGDPIKKNAITRDDEGYQTYDNQDGDSSIHDIHCDRDSSGEHQQFETESRDIQNGSDRGDIVEHRPLIEHDELDTLSVNDVEHIQEWPPEEQEQPENAFASASSKQHEIEQDELQEESEIAFSQRSFTDVLRKEQAQGKIFHTENDEVQSMPDDEHIADNTQYINTQAHDQPSHDEPDPIQSVDQGYVMSSVTTYLPDSELPQRSIQDDNHDSLPISKAILADIRQRRNLKSPEPGDAGKNPKEETMGLFDELHTVLRSKKKEDRESAEIEYDVNEERYNGNVKPANKHLTDEDDVSNVNVKARASLFEKITEETGTKVIPSFGGATASHSYLRQTSHSSTGPLVTSSVKSESLGVHRNEATAVGSDQDENTNSSRRESHSNPNDQEVQRESPHDTSQLSISSLQSNPQENMVEKTSETLSESGVTYTFNRGEDSYDEPLDAIKPTLSLLDDTENTMLNGEEDDSPLVNGEVSSSKGIALPNGDQVGDLTYQQEHELDQSFPSSEQPKEQRLSLNNNFGNNVDASMVF